MSVPVLKAKDTITPSSASTNERGSSTRSRASVATVHQHGFCWLHGHGCARAHKEPGSTPFLELYTIRWQLPEPVIIEPIDKMRYLCRPTGLTLRLTGQGQKLSETREPGTAVKLGLCHSPSTHVRGNVCVEHGSFAEPLAYHIAKGHPGVIHLCQGAVARFAHHGIAG